MTHTKQTCQIARVILPARVFPMLLTVTVSALTAFILTNDMGKYLQISAKIWREYNLLWAKAITEKQSQAYHHTAFKLPIHTCLPYESVLSYYFTPQPITNVSIRWQLSPEGQTKYG